MYSKIYNPITHKLINTYSRQGMVVLQKYINQNGGFNNLFSIQSVYTPSEDYHKESISLNSLNRDEIIVGEMRRYNSENNSDVLNNSILTPIENIGYFEPQHNSLCGGHALNHLLGYKKFLNSQKLHIYENNNSKTTGFYTLSTNAIDTAPNTYTSTIYSNETQFWSNTPEIKINLYSKKIVQLFDTHSEDVTGKYQARMEPVTFSSIGTGNYTIQYLIFILQKLGYTTFNNATSNQVDISFKKDKLAIGLSQDTYFGTLLNVNSVHWTLIKKLKNNVFIYIDSIEYETPVYLDLEGALHIILEDNIKGFIEVHKETSYKQRHFIPQDNSFASWIINGKKYYYNDTYKIQDTKGNIHVLRHEDLMVNSHDEQYVLASKTYNFKVSDAFSGERERIYYDPLSDLEIVQASTFYDFLQKNTKIKNISFPYHNLGESQHQSNDPSVIHNLEYDMSTLALKLAITQAEKSESTIDLDNILLNASELLNTSIEIKNVVCVQCGETFQRPNLDTEGKSILDANRCTYMKENTKFKTPCCFHCKNRKSIIVRKKKGKQKKIQIGDILKSLSTINTTNPQELSKLRKQIKVYLSRWDTILNNETTPVSIEARNMFLDMLQQELEIKKK